MVETICTKQFSTLVTFVAIFAADFLFTLAARGQAVGSHLLVTYITFAQAIAAKCAAALRTRFNARLAHELVACFAPGITAIAVMGSTFRTRKHFFTRGAAEITRIGVFL